MSHTLTIDGLGGTAADVSVYQLDQSTLVELATTRDPDGSISTQYLVPGVDANYPVILTVRNFRDAKKPDSLRRAALSLSAWARDVDSVSGLTILKPITITTTIYIPGMSVETVDVLTGVENLFGLFFHTLTSKVPDTLAMAAIIAGATKLY